MEAAKAGVREVRQPHTQVCVVCTRRWGRGGGRGGGPEGKGAGVGGKGKGLPPAASRAPAAAGGRSTNHRWHAVWSNQGSTGAVWNRYI